MSSLPTNESKMQQYEPALMLRPINYVAKQCKSAGYAYTNDEENDRDK